MGHYNKRHTHTLRTFVVGHEKIFGAPATAYTQELHRWFTRGLSARSACVTFPARNARSFRVFVTDLQAVLGSDFTVAWSTVFVLRCETRQVCQTYGIDDRVEYRVSAGGIVHLGDGNDQMVGGER